MSPMPVLLDATRATDERTELLELLRRDAILRRTDAQPVLSRDGTSARWMLDSLAVTLTPRGAELAARALLDALRAFEGRQLATLGLTGVPLLQGCVLHGGGRYRGVLVRKERKAHGSLKLIEGKLDPAEPVVMVDDSISSGQSMLTCAQRLEEAGFHVEGALGLVHFGYDRGLARLVARGYRAAAVFDIFTDFMPFLDGEEPRPANPTRAVGPLVPAPRRAAEGLHPAHLAREVMAEYLRSGQVLRAPATLDGGYASAGGCWVSVRRRGNVHDRPARSGFWRFPGEPDAPVVDDVVFAAVRTATELARGHADAVGLLADCAVAVTFFDALEECTVGELDDDRYGIVVRSRERPARMGGALPRMPGIGTDWQQYAHAAFRNARLLPGEAHVIYRHDVHKVVEPGAAWQRTGVPAPGPVDTGVARAAAQQALDLVRGRVEQGTAPTDDVTLPDGTVGVFVTVYADGRLAGCAGVVGDGCGRRVPECVAAAAHDGRFAAVAAGSRLAVGLSLLTDRHEIGVADPDWVVHPVRFADQALAVRQRDRFGFVLPSVAVTHNLTPRRYVAEVIDKAGITRPPYRWTRYDCATWLADASGVRATRHGLPVGTPAATPAQQVTRLRELLLRYATRHHVGPDEPYGGRYDPAADRIHAGAHPARIAYGAWALARAGLADAARDDLARPEAALGADGWPAAEGGSIAEPAFGVLARIELGLVDTTTAALAATLADRIDGHGRFATHRDPAAARPAFQDYAPGQALLALATAARAGLVDAEAPAVTRALRYYRIRFRQNRSWGAVSWLAQAYAAWGDVRDDLAATAFAFEIADGAAAFQSRHGGGFLGDHQPDAPGATTALYLEGIAAARAAAQRVGDAEREARYRDVCARAVMFLDELVYQERDAAVLRNPEWAIGGLRTAPTAGEVRLDYVHHGLCAVLALDGVFEETS